MADLEGIIDLHVHAGPDVRVRKMSLVDLAQAADDAGMRSLLVKNHHTSTVLAASAVMEQGPGIRVFGGLALNEWVGGLNPGAVDAALKMGARAIWMPTLSAENERIHLGKPGTGITVLDPGGGLKEEVQEILRLIAESDVILATGHLSPAEIVAVVKAARIGTIACSTPVCTVCCGSSFRSAARHAAAGGWSTACLPKTPIHLTCATRHWSSRP